MKHALGALALFLPLVACTQTTSTSTPAPSSGSAGSTPASTPDEPTEEPAAEPVVDEVATGPMAELRKFIDEQGIDTSSEGWKLKLPRPPKLTFPAGTEVTWTLETSEGTVVCKLLHDVAPMHVSSTMYLTELGFYDDLTFHRIITNFMAQGGCPLGKGVGGPGYKYGGEFSPDVRHDRPGLLSMANAGPNTDGSQFFLTFVPTAWLDGKHTIFGEVVSGMDAVKKMESKGSQGGTPTAPVALKKATITVK